MKQNGKKVILLRFNKKGFVFTSVAVIVVIVLIVFLTQEHLTFPRTASQTARVHTMDSFLLSLEEDLPRAAFIAGFRCFIALEEHVTDTNAYLPSVDNAFTECFLNGTINSSTYAILDNSTFVDFTQRFSTLASRQGMNPNLTVTSVHAEHNEPFAIDVEVNMTVKLSDNVGLASFTRNITVFATVPVNDIKDPLYSIGTQGRTPHPVKISTVDRPFITATSDTTNLELVRNSSAYIASSLAPSFLQRFEGNFSPSPFGIQSLVDVQLLRAQDVAVDTCRSLVDWRYFGISTTTNYLVVNMDPDELWLAAEDLSTYDAVGKTVGLKVCT